MPHPQHHERTILVFLYDRERDLRTGYKTRGAWTDGRFDATPWLPGGELRCDSVRGRLLHGSGEYPRGESRFVVEQILEWDTGETVYSETGRA